MPTVQQRFYLQHQIQVPPSDSQSEETAETIREAGNRFLDSRVREIALNVDEVYRECHIHAEIGSHIVNGTADRLFKAARGLWQVINYERDRVDWEEIGDPSRLLPVTNPNYTLCLSTGSTLNSKSYR